MRNLVEEALARSGSWESIIQWAINEARNESFSESFDDRKAIGELNVHRD